MERALIRATGLSKRYEERLALDDVSFSVAAGEIVGLLGPNGAGKTTTLSLLAGVLRADCGTVEIDGHDLIREAAAARSKLGLVPQSLALYPTLTAGENLRFFGRIQGVSAVAVKRSAQAGLTEVGLADCADGLVAHFSGGMKRRLNLACGILHAPKVLLLDEPTLGVDPQSRERIFAVIERATERGAAVLYSTHYMEEAERLCDRIVLIDGGRIAAQGTVEELIAVAGNDPTIEIVTQRRMEAGWASGLASVREGSAGLEHEHRTQVSITRLELIPELIRRAETAGGAIREFHLHRATLQDAFMKLTGHDLRDAP